jgi:hypothetical protein
VLYRLTEVGEVVAAGGKALTLVNLGDVYMEIFLPSEQAARLKIGAEARITVDYAPGRAAAGYVSFVSPEAQFTPKQVETRSEREKLMFRVKIRIPLASIAISDLPSGRGGMVSSTCPVRSFFRQQLDKALFEILGTGPVHELHRCSGRKHLPSVHRHNPITLLGRKRQFQPIQAPKISKLR